MKNPDLVFYIGLTAGILTSISMLPQLFKTIKKKKADDVSPFMLVVLISGIASWIIYGTLKKDIPIIITNSIALFFNIWMLILRYKYKK